MGQVDSVTKAYVQHNVVFADIFNQFIYDGRQVIQPDNLRELDTTALGRGRNGKMLQKNRDVLKLAMKTDGRTAYCILGVENQTKIHYAMVVRNMLYDALRLDEQVRHTISAPAMAKTRNIAMKRSFSAVLPRRTASCLSSR